MSLLWPELTFGERFHAARDHGFSAVEFWPWEDPHVIRREISATGLVVSVLNVDPGPDGSNGKLADPEAVEWWQEALASAIRLAQDVGCTTVNALTGNRIAKFSMAEQLETAARNLATGLDRIDGVGVDLVLEPLGPDRPDYLTRTVEDARQLCRAAGDPPHLGILFDFYHLHQTESRPVSEVYRDAAALTKHIQVADVPGRHEPGHGEINWARCRRAVEASDYDGWIGLEYVPSADTATSLMRIAQVWGQRAEAG
ncbi:hydroxypyruvate isomerase family protein [Streptomyces chartreusis]|uniref:TIM barrel protein n=1 Tax=Streptomyces chartreusis TaxID=1969 RepID=A0A7H8T1D2_STRCX|nr:TIM barrel protein [Streptomyces chartreusis]QKZ17295.1 TIM barrel protein [Streptomyces chartreusis]